MVSSRERDEVSLYALDGVSTGVDEAARCFDDLLRQWHWHHHTTKTTILRNVSAFRVVEQ